MTKKEKPGWIDEFKAFIAKGNVMSLAVGVIIGGAFSTITSSLTNDIIMPIVSMIFGGVNFDNWQLTLPNFWHTIDAETGELAVNTLNFGTFLSAVLNFLILAFVVFWIVKIVNRVMDSAKKKEEEAPAAPPAPSAEEVLLTEIRDLLKEKKES
ncbi:MAG: large-conductance mechanosensitive channel protein MscL [Oscillospiraceae bacterium]|nr:large-conductance mechanosensitive channel protein MscL [Oscillospiraceae bacterium]